ncbi:tRNA(fMet)-specific endonuclease VapC [Tepidimonas sediminis]|uniref:Ribonuclease VapC n=1 Tax=Tepidimonas sediminis TaxID=2588941 RepID=A0A554WSX2_9BURK|nr:type II toxin-antitoxin system VapC family toxin [Tepidimonas sediminis]TSE26686.1 tRNA(fMet)-specific endonuclease VapC [Tepidimonas sediminis]
MPSLDTNVLVRWLVADDATQADRVLALLAQAQRRGEPLWVPVTVVLELEWVLRSRYGYRRAQILMALDALLQTRELAWQHEAAVEEALWRCRRDEAPDFADCLHLALAAQAGQTPWWTFDRRAARADPARWLAAPSTDDA